MEIFAGARPRVIPAFATAGTLAPSSRWERALGMSQNRKIRHGHESGTRTADLIRLLPLWPQEAADRSPAGRRRILELLRRALRAERRRGQAGHWTYDLSRHAQLLALYRTECADDPGTPRPATSRAPCASPIPSSWPDPSAPAHSSARPSDNPAATPTSPGTRPAKGCSGSASAVSAT